MAPGQTDTEFLVKAERIVVADTIAAAEAQLLEIRGGFHGLAGEEADLLRAHLTAAVGVVRRGLRRKCEDAELVLEGRFPGLYRRRGGRPAREGTAAESSFEFEADAALRPRSAVGAVAEHLHAERRLRVRQTLAEAKETRKLYNVNLKEYRVPALQLAELYPPPAGPSSSRAVRFDLAAEEEEAAYDPWEIGPPPTRRRTDGDGDRFNI